MQKSAKTKDFYVKLWIKLGEIHALESRAYFNDFLPANYHL